MKKLTATFGLAAAVGLTALSAAPASAAPFANCTEARAAGQVNIPRSSPLYAPKLDSNNDGIACEQPGQPTPQPTVQPQPNVPGQQDVTDQQMTGQQQVRQIPVGAPDTGVTPRAASDGPDVGTLTAGGGIALAALGAGAWGVRHRRRSTALHNTPSR